MRLLAFETAGDGCSAGCFDDGYLLALERHTEATGHAELLVPMLGAVLARAGWGMTDPEALAVTIGPGSFTGIRTGLAAARGFALVHHQPVWPVTSLAVRAAMVAERGGAGGLPIAVVLDARRGHLFLQRFDASGMPLDGPMVVTPERAAAQLKGPHLLIGDGVPAALRHLDARAMRFEDAVPDAAAVALAAEAMRRRGEAPVPGTDLLPLYLREPDARPAAGRPLLSA